MCDCLSGDAIDGDPRQGYLHEWQTGMCWAPCANPLCFCAAVFCPCPSACWTRRLALGGEMAYYKCCQGYYDMLCWKAGSLGESSCPDLCNMLEAWLCFGCHISSSRALVMDTRSIKPDPCDNRLIALNNALVILSCICDMLAMCFEEMEGIADLVDFITDIVTTIVSSCMIAQTHLEVTSAPKPLDMNKASQYPRGHSKQMQRFQSGGGGGGGGGIPMQANMGGGYPPSQPAYGGGYGAPPPGYGGGGYGAPPPGYGGGYGAQPGYGR